MKCDPAVIASLESRPGAKSLGIAVEPPPDQLTYDDTMILFLPCQPPTLNQLMRGHIRTRIRLGKQFRAVVAGRWRGPKATGKRRVSIEIVLGPRQRGADPDAFFKAVGDSLVKCGALKDDTRHGVEWGPVTYSRGPEQGTVIILEDIHQ
jgi:hypothetical protein